MSQLFVSICILLIVSFHPSVQQAEYPCNGMSGFNIIPCKYFNSLPINITVPPKNYFGNEGIRYVETPRIQVLDPELINQDNHRKNGN